jgi:hypothetical protein
MSKTVSDSSTYTKMAAWIAWLVIVLASGFFIFVLWGNVMWGGGTKNNDIFNLACIAIPAVFAALSFLLMVSKKQGYGLALALSIVPCLVVAIYIF